MHNTPQLTFSRNRRHKNSASGSRLLAPQTDNEMNSRIPRGYGNLPYSVSAGNFRSKAQTDTEGFGRNQFGVNSTLSMQKIGDDRRRQRMKERINDPRFKGNEQLKAKKQQKLNNRIREELRKHIVNLEQSGNIPTMPADGEIQYAKFFKN